jgi:hypothetical protein
MGMQNISSSSITRWVPLIAQVRSRIFAPDFWARHRRSACDFTRKRLLPFPVVMLFLLQKTTQSVQRHLHFFLHELWPQSEDCPATPGGWTQARAKLSHTAFIELNQEVLLPCFYAPDQAGYRRTWRGHRLLGGDGSLLRLPSHPEVVEIFGAVAVANHLGDTGTCYTPARLSVLYDLLNHIGLDARLAPVAEGETDLLAAVFVSNLETLLSRQAQEELSAGDAGRKYPAQVNRADSYHALKERMLDLLWSPRPLEKVLEEMQRWMQSNPVSVRPNRRVPRRPQSFHRSYQYQRNVRKSVF